MGCIRNPKLTAMLGMPAFFAAMVSLMLSPRNTVRPPPQRWIISSMGAACGFDRSEENTSELQSLMRISYDVFCLKKKNIKDIKNNTQITYIITSEKNLTNKPE